MATDFLDAAARHLSDAQLLEGATRYANADHLYGIAAECMLKAIMVGLGAPVGDQGGVPEPARETRIDELWSEFCAFAGGAAGASYLPFQPTDCPFPDWDIGQRYDPHGRFTADWLQGKHRREDVQAIASSLQAALLDGILYVAPERK